MGLIATKPLTTRDPGPYPANRTCPSCGCYLSRYNPKSLCDPDPAAVEIVGALRDVADGAEANPSQGISTLITFEDWVNDESLPDRLRLIADGIENARR